jgi:hypothetical protein
MVKDFDEHLSKHAREQAEQDKKRREYDEQISANAADLEQRIANHMRKHNVSGVKLGIDQSNKLVLSRNGDTDRLTISMNQTTAHLLGNPIEWRYTLLRERAGRGQLQRDADNKDMSHIEEGPMIVAVDAWLRRA